jgi:hypothetical protein
VCLPFKNGDNPDAMKLELARTGKPDAQSPNFAFNRSSEGRRAKAHHKGTVFS